MPHTESVKNGVPLQGCHLYSSKTSTTTSSHRSRSCCAMDVPQVAVTERWQGSTAMAGECTIDQRTTEAPPRSVMPHASIMSSRSCCGLCRGFKKHAVIKAPWWPTAFPETSSTLSSKGCRFSACTFQMYSNCSMRQWCDTSSHSCMNLATSSTRGFDSLAQIGGFLLSEAAEAGFKFARHR